MGENLKLAGKSQKLGSVFLEDHLEVNMDEHDDM
jgi:hypothetical protein